MLFLLLTASHFGIKNPSPITLFSRRLPGHFFLKILYGFYMKIVDCGTPSKSRGRQKWIQNRPTDKDGETINSEHILMKWTPTPCIKYYAEQHSITVSDIYKEVYNNEVIKFDLTSCGNKFVCRSSKQIYYGTGRTTNSC